MSPRVFSHEPINFRHMPPAIKALVIANVASSCSATSSAIASSTSSDWCRIMCFPTVGSGSP